MDSFMFMSGGYTRTVWHKNNGTAATAVVWLDGGGEAEGQNILRSIPTTGATLDLAPDGIFGPTSSWVKPWRPNPPGVPLDADVVFLDDLYDEVRRMFPNIDRVFLAGYSGGGGMVQEYLRSRVLTHKYDGYAVVKRVLHTSMIDADGAAITPVAPFILWYGEYDPHNIDVPEHVNSVESLNAYRKTYGLPEELPLPAAGTCCGQPTLRYTEGLFTYILDSGPDGHAFLRCGEGGIARALKRQWIG